MSSLWANSCSTTSRPRPGLAASRQADGHTSMIGPSAWWASPSTAPGAVHQHALGRAGHRGRASHRAHAHDDRADPVERRAVEAQGEQAGVAGDDRAHLVGELLNPAPPPSASSARRRRPARRAASRSASSSSAHWADRAARMSRHLRWEARPLAVEEARHPLSQSEAYASARSSASSRMARPGAHLVVADRERRHDVHAG